jgi:hypothetical protein
MVNVVSAVAAIHIFAGDSTMKSALQLALIAGLGACGVADLDTGQTVQGLTYGNNVFYEKFDPLAVGTIGGQSGWTGDCAVAAATAPDKNLRCTGAAGLTNGRGAMHAFSRPLNVDYHLQFDVWTEGVVDSTHGKVFLEAPPRRRHQLDPPDRDRLRQYPGDVRVPR